MSSIVYLYVCMYVCMYVCRTVLFCCSVSIGSYQSQSGGGGGEGGKPPGGGGPILPLIRPLMSVGSYPQLPPNMPPYPPPPPLFGGPRGFPPGFNPNMRPPPLLPPSATTSSQSQPQSVNAPWKQHQAPPTNSQTTPTAPTHQLQLVREELQKELEIYGITDPMEVEFGKVVKQLMDSCTKDSIAVSVCAQQVPVILMYPLRCIFLLRCICSLARAGFSPMPNYPTSVPKLQSTSCESERTHTHTHLYAI